MSNKRIERIRSRANERKSSGQIGGVREWFEIEVLLAHIDSQDRELRDARNDNEELKDFQNSIASRMPESYDGEEAQEAIIDRWLDDITKPHTITTIEELDALPVGSVILDPAGLSLHKNEFTGWRASNGAKNIPADMLEREALPATVLHEAVTA